MTPRIPLRLDPPEKPANATGHFIDCGHSFRIASRAAPSKPSRHWVESMRGLIVASGPRTTQPSAVAGARYQSASIALVRLKSLVEVTTSIGQGRDGSKPAGNASTARPISGLGLPPWLATSWKYFATGKRISILPPGWICWPARAAAWTDSLNPRQINPRINERTLIDNTMDGAMKGLATCGDRQMLAP